MKRLTIRSGFTGETYLTGEADVCWANRPIEERAFCAGCHRHKGKDRTNCGALMLIDRLAAIEDILCDGEDEYDLERLAAVYNQRVSMRDEVSQRFSLTAKIPLDRLRELVEMDSAGCIPPCKIGDVFYRVYYGFDSPEIEKYRVSMVTQKADRSWRIRATDTESSFQIDWSLDDFSKRAYKTREEAEAALAKIAD